MELKHKFADKKFPLNTFPVLNVDSKINNQTDSSNNARVTKNALSVEEEAVQVRQLREKNNSLFQALSRLEAQLEEGRLKFKALKKINSEANNNILHLEKEISNLKQSLKIANDKLKELSLLKQKNETLEKDLSYKLSIISYLEKVLKIQESKKIFL